MTLLNVVLPTRHEAIKQAHETARDYGGKVRRGPRKTMPFVVLDEEGVEVAAYVSKAYDKRVRGNG